MRVLRAPGELADLLAAHRAAGRNVGLVPTMGALHAGHRSLVRRSTAECDVTVVTIFVNPLQFGDAADLEHYPRTPEADLAACEESGVDVVFAPGVEDMYPCWPGPLSTTVHVGPLGAGWEGQARPGHFDGVATVVAKLFAMVGPCRAYFGEKDFQQLAIVRRLAADLSFPVTVVGCATVREADGLALSSRNARLSDAGRGAAAVLWRALSAGADAVAAGVRDPALIETVMADVVAAEPLVALDYAGVVDAADLDTPASLEPDAELRLLVAARVGPVRLIDNCAARSRTIRAEDLVGVRSFAGGR